MIRVAVLGIGGRMGARIAAAVRAEPDLRIAAATERPDSPHVGRDAGIVAGIGEASVPVSGSIEEALSRGVDVAIDCTVGAGAAPTLLGIEALKRRAGTMVVQGEGNQEFPSFPIGRLTRKGITLKSARGHSYRAVELALRQLASHRFPLEMMMTHTFGLAQVDYAIKSVGGEGAPGAIHVSVLPWK